jgi:hypothetical protein
MEPKETAVVRQRFGKHLTTMNTHAKREELLDAVFYMRSASYFILTVSVVSVAMWLGLGLVKNLSVFFSSQNSLWIYFFKYYFKLFTQMWFEWIKEYCLLLVVCFCLLLAWIYLHSKGRLLLPGYTASYPRRLVSYFKLGYRRSFRAGTR